LSGAKTREWVWQIRGSRRRRLAAVARAGGEGIADTQESLTDLGNSLAKMLEELDEEHVTGPRVV